MQYTCQSSHLRRSAQRGARIFASLLEAFAVNQGPVESLLLIAETSCSGSQLDSVDACCCSRGQFNGWEHSRAALHAIVGLHGRPSCEPQTMHMWQSTAHAVMPICSQPSMQQPACHAVVRALGAPG